MPTKIGPRNSNLYDGIVFLVIYPIFFVVCLFTIVPDALSRYHSYGFRWEILPAAIFPILLGIIAFRFVPKFLATPFWAIIDDDLKTMEFKYLSGSPNW